MQSYRATVLLGKKGYRVRVGDVGLYRVKGLMVRVRVIGSRPGPG